MYFDMENDANEVTKDEDVKPIIASEDAAGNGVGVTVDLVGGPKKWSPGCWQDGNRKSAFQPYKQNMLCTVLTNLQRGNVQAEGLVPQPTEISFHTRAGQGEITLQDVKKQASINVRDGSGLTALHWASAYGQFNAVQLLQSNSAEIDVPGPDGESPLLLAANGGHIDIVRLLLNAGANVNHADDVGNTALMYAASGNHPHCCNELLLRGADITAVNLNGDTAFSLAVDNASNLAQAVVENHLLTLLG